MTLSRRGMLGAGLSTALVPTLAAAASVPGARASASARLAPTPPMGWNSWNSFATTITEEQTLEQAAIMDQHINVLKIIHLTCEDETEMFARLRKRALKSNRHDDADEKVIRHRWEVYSRETAPVLRHYPDDKIVDIDSMGSPARILHDILDHAVPQQDNHFKAFEG